MRPDWNAATWRKNDILTLGELEALACLGLTGFLTLYRTRVAGHEAFCTECGLVLGVNLYKSAGDSQTECLCLSFVTAAVEVDLDVILAFRLRVLPEAALRYTEV